MPKLHELINANRGSVPEDIGVQKAARSVDLPDNLQIDDIPAAFTKPIPKEYMNQRLYRQVPLEIYMRQGMEGVHELAAQRQTALDQWVNGTIKAAGKVVNYTVLGLAGSLYGFGSMIANRDFKKLFDNDVMNAMVEVDEFLAEALPNLRTRREREMGLFRRMLTSNFLADEVLGAVAFLASAYLSGYASSLGISKALALGRSSLFNALTKTDYFTKIGSQLSKATAISRAERLTHTAFTTYMSAGFESAFEANHAKHDLVATLIDAHKKRYFRDPTDDELEKINNIADSLSSGVFVANLATVGASNILMFGKLMAAPITSKVTGSRITRLSDSFSRFSRGVKVATEGGETVLKSRYTSPWFRTYKRAAYGFQIGREGLEEGLQGLYSGVAHDYVMKKYSMEGADGAYSFIDALGKQTGEYLQNMDTDAYSEVVVGMLMGAVGLPGTESFLENLKGVFKPSMDEQVKVAMDRFNKMSSKDRTIAAIQALNRQIQLNLEQEDDDVFDVKNKEAESIFNTLFARAKFGLEDTFQQDVEALLKNISKDEFEEQFGYENLTNEEFENRKKHILEKTKKITQEFKDSYTRARTLSYSDDDEITEGFAYLFFGAKDIDRRIERITEELSKAGLLPEGTTDFKKFILEGNYANFMHERANDLREKIREIDEALKEADLGAIAQLIDSKEIPQEIKDLYPEDEQKQKIETAKRVKEQYETQQKSLEELGKIYKQMRFVYHEMRKTLPEVHKTWFNKRSKPGERPMEMAKRTKEAKALVKKLKDAKKDMDDFFKYLENLTHDTVNALPEDVAQALIEDKERIDKYSKALDDFITLVETYHTAMPRFVKIDNENERLKELRKYKKHIKKVAQALGKQIDFDEYQLTGDNAEEILNKAFMELFVELDNMFAKARYSPTLATFKYFSDKIIPEGDKVDIQREFLAIRALYNTALLNRQRVLHEKMEEWRQKAEYAEQKRDIEKDPMQYLEEAIAAAYELDHAKAEEFRRKASDLTRLAHRRYVINNEIKLLMNKEYQHKFTEFKNKVKTAIPRAIAFDHIYKDIKLRRKVGQLISLYHQMLDQQKALDDAIASMEPEYQKLMQEFEEDLANFLRSLDVPVPASLIKEFFSKDVTDKDVQNTLKKQIRPFVLSEAEAEAVYKEIMKPYTLRVKFIEAKSLEEDINNLKAQKEVIDKKVEKAREDLEQKIMDDLSQSENQAMNRLQTLQGQRDAAVAIFNQIHQTVYGDGNFQKAVEQSPEYKEVVKKLDRLVQRINALNEFAQEEERKRKRVEEEIGKGTPVSDEAIEKRTKRYEAIEREYARMQELIGQYQELLNEIIKNKQLHYVERLTKLYDNIQKIKEGIEANARMLQNIAKPDDFRIIQEYYEARRELTADFMMHLRQEVINLDDITTGTEYFNTLFKNFYKIYYGGKGVSDKEEDNKEVVEAEDLIEKTEQGGPEPPPPPVQPGSVDPTVTKIGGKAVITNLGEFFRIYQMYENVSEEDGVDENGNVKYKLKPEVLAAMQAYQSGKASIHLEIRELPEELAKPIPSNRNENVVIFNPIIDPNTKKKYAVYVVVTPHNTGKPVEVGALLSPFRYRTKEGKIIPLDSYEVAKDLIEIDGKPISKEDHVRFLESLLPLTHFWKSVIIPSLANATKQNPDTKTVVLDRIIGTSFEIEGHSLKPVIYLTTIDKTKESYPAEQLLERFGMTHPEINGGEPFLVSIKKNKEGNYIYFAYLKDNDGKYRWKELTDNDKAGKFKKYITRIKKAYEEQQKHPIPKFKPGNLGGVLVEYDGNDFIFGLAYKDYEHGEVEDKVIADLITMGVNAYSDERIAEIAKTDPEYAKVLADVKAAATTKGEIAFKNIRFSTVVNEKTPEGRKKAQKSNLFINVKQFDNEDGTKNVVLDFTLTSTAFGVDEKTGKENKVFINIRTKGQEGDKVAITINGSAPFDPVLDKKLKGQVLSSVVKKEALGLKSLIHILDNYNAIPANKTIKDIIIEHFGLDSIYIVPTKRPAEDEHYTKMQERTSATFKVLTKNSDLSKVLDEISKTTTTTVNPQQQLSPEAVAAEARSILGLPEGTYNSREDIVNAFMAFGFPVNPSNISDDDVLLITKGQVTDTKNYTLFKTLGVEDKLEALLQKVGSTVSPSGGFEPDGENPEGGEPDSLGEDVFGNGGNMLSILIAANRGQVPVNIARQAFLENWNADRQKVEQEIYAAIRIAQKTGKEIPGIELTPELIQSIPRLLDNVFGESSTSTESPTQQGTQEGTQQGTQSSEGKRDNKQPQGETETPPSDEGFFGEDVPFEEGHEDIYDFKITPQVTDPSSFEREKEIVESILGKDVQVDKVVNNIVTRGVINGYVHKGVIYLAQTPQKGTGAHEAIHYIFRAFLSNEEIDEIFNAARKRYGKPTKEQLDELRSTYEGYEHLTQEELTNLWYEERIADDFIDYYRENKLEKKNEEDLGFWQRLFQYLKSLINKLFNRPDAIDRLYKSAVDGKFIKQGASKYRVVYGDAPMFSIHTLYPHTMYNIESKKYAVSNIGTVLNDADVNLIASSVAMLLHRGYVVDDLELQFANEDKEGKKRISIEDAIKIVVSDLYDFRKYERAIDMSGNIFARLYYQNRMRAVFNAFRKNFVVLSKDKKSFVQKPNPFYGENIKKLKKKIKEIEAAAYGIEETYNPLQSDEDGTEEALMIDAGLRDQGFKTLNRFAKMYLFKIKAQYDFFEFNKYFSNTDLNQEFTVPVDYLYNSIVTITANTPKELIIRKLYEYKDTNVFIQHFWKSWTIDIANELNEGLDNPRYHSDDIQNIPHEQLMKSSIYKTMINAFDKANEEVLDIVYDRKNRKFSVFESESTSTDYSVVASNWYYLAKRNAVVFDKTTLETLRDDKVGSIISIIKQLQSISDKRAKEVFQAVTKGIEESGDLRNVADIRQVVIDALDIRKGIDNTAEGLMLMGISLPKEFIEIVALNALYQGLHANPAPSNETKGLAKIIDYILGNDKLPQDINILDTFGGLTNSLNEAIKADIYHDEFVEKFYNDVYYGAISRIKDLARLSFKFTGYTKNFVVLNSKGNRIYTIVNKSLDNNIISRMRQYETELIEVIEKKKFDDETFLVLKKVFGINSKDLAYQFYISHLVNNPFFDRIRVSVKGETKKELYAQGLELFKVMSAKSRAGQTGFERVGDYADMSPREKLLLKLALYDKGISKGRRFRSLFIPTVYSDNRTAKAIVLPARTFATREGITKDFREAVRKLYKGAVEKINLYKKVYETSATEGTFGTYVNGEFVEFKTANGYSTLEYNGKPYFVYNNQAYFVDPKTKAVRKAGARDNDAMVQQWRNKPPRALQILDLPNIVDAQGNISDEDIDKFALDLIKRNIKELNKHNIILLTATDLDALEEAQTIPELVKIPFGTFAIGQNTDSIFNSGGIQNTKMTRVDSHHLMNFVLNNFIVSASYNRLMSGDMSIYKDPLTFVKRNKGIIAHGSGDETVNVATVQEKYAEVGHVEYRGKQPKVIKPVFERITEINGKNKVDITDGQSYATAEWYYDVYLNALGKITNDEVIQNIKRKIVLGIPINSRERRFLEKSLTIVNNKKPVLRDLFSYIKTSTFILTREFTSRIKLTPEEHADRQKAGKAIRRKREELMSLYNAYERAKRESDIDTALLIRKEMQKYYEAIPGREELHAMLNAMELENVDLSVVTSGEKMLAVDVGDYNQESGEYELNPSVKSFFSEQVVAEGSKEGIYHPVQLAGLVWSDQNYGEIVTINGKRVNPVQLGNAYRKMYADRMKVAREIIDLTKPLNEEMLKKIVATAFDSLEAGKSHLHLVGGFYNGKPVIDLNMPTVIRKVEEAVTKYYGERIIRFKRSGTKLTLTSPYGVNVAVDENDNVIPASKLDPGKEYATRPLKYAIKEGDVYYAEAIVPKWFADKYGLAPGSEVQFPSEAFRKATAVRIPTQDKSFMVTIKVVDVLPEHYGSAAFLPKEFILMSGTDFDFDALYVSTWEVYRPKKGKKKVYGFYTSEEEFREQAYDEFLAFDEKARRIKGKEREQYINGLIDKYIEKHREQLEKNIEAYKEGEFWKVSPLLVHEANNLMLALEQHLIANTLNEDKAFRAEGIELFTEEEFGFQETIKELFGEDAIEVGLDTDNYYDPATVNKMQEINDGGKSSVGIAAATNTAIRKILEDWFSMTVGDKADHEKRMQKYINAIVGNKAITLPTIMSAAISLEVDNSKHALANTLNLVGDSLSAFLMATAYKVDYRIAGAMINTPLVKNFINEYNSRRGVLAEESLERRAKRGHITEDAWKAAIKKTAKDYGMTVDDTFVDTYYNALVTGESPETVLSGLSDFTEYGSKEWGKLARDYDAFMKEATAAKEANPIAFNVVMARMYREYVELSQQFMPFNIVHGATKRLSGDYITIRNIMEAYTTLNSGNNPFGSGVNQVEIAEAINNVKYVRDILKRFLVRYTDSFDSMVDNLLEEVNLRINDPKFNNMTMDLLTMIAIDEFAKDSNPYPMAILERKDDKSAIQYAIEQLKASKEFGSLSILDYIQVEEQQAIIDGKEKVVYRITMPDANSISTYEYQKLLEDMMVLYSAHPYAIESIEHANTPSKLAKYVGWQLMKYAFVVEGLKYGVRNVSRYLSPRQMVYLSKYFKKAVDTVKGFDEGMRDVYITKLLERYAADRSRGFGVIRSVNHNALKFGGVLYTSAEGNKVLRMVTYGDKKKSAVEKAERLRKAGVLSERGPRKFINVWGYDATIGDTYNNLHKNIGNIWNVVSGKGEDASLSGYFVQTKGISASMMFGTRKVGRDKATLQVGKEDYNELLAKFKNKGLDQVLLNFMAFNLKYTKEEIDNLINAVTKKDKEAAKQLMQLIGRKEKVEVFITDEFIHPRSDEYYLKEAYYANLGVPEGEFSHFGLRKTGTMFPLLSQKALYDTLRFANMFYNVPESRGRSVSAGIERIMNTTVNPLKKQC